MTIIVGKDFPLFSCKLLFNRNKEGHYFGRRRIESQSQTFLLKTHSAEEKCKIPTLYLLIFRNDFSNFTFKPLGKWASFPPSNPFGSFKSGELRSFFPFIKRILIKRCVTVHMPDRCGQDQFTAGVQRAEIDGGYGNAIPLKIYVLFMMIRWCQRGAWIKEDLPLLNQERDSISYLESTNIDGVLITAVEIRRPPAKRQ